MSSGKDRPIPPLGPVIGRLLEAERATAAAPTDLRARVMSRARRTLSQPASRPFRRPESAKRLRFAVAAGVVLAGAGAIAGIHGGWQGRPRDLPVAPPATVATRAVAVPAAASAPMALPAPEPVRASRSAPRARSRVRDPRIELELLDQAREAVRAGRFEAALAILELHALKFPEGSLVEEREALLIRTLSSLGRSFEARQAAAAFRQRFPRSVLGQRVGEMSAVHE
jgi:hypothetical protein